MQRWKALAIVAGGVGLAWFGMQVQQSRVSAGAHEFYRAQEAKRERPAAQPPAKLDPDEPQRPYPVFSIAGVLEKLTTEGAVLLEKDSVKGSDALRAGLENATVTLSLPKPASKTLPIPELYQRASDSVFLVAGLTKPDGEVHEGWQTAFSTAFAVHEDGILSTSAHVFDHDDHDHAVVVLDVKGQVHPVVEVLAADLKTDTCLFRIAAKGLKPLPLGTDAPPGTEIRVMGHPGDSFYFLSAGIIANYERDEEQQLWLNVTADFGQGSSGGPVLDAAGNVVGQVSRTYTLYAGGGASRRVGRGRAARQAADADLPGAPKKLADVEEEHRRSADPQMTFKSCTPVSAIRALLK